MIEAQPLQGQKATSWGGYVIIAALAASALVGVGVAAGQLGPIIAIASVGGLLIAGAALASEWAGLAILIGSMFFDPVTVPVGDLFNVRPSFFVFAIVFPIILFHWLMSRRRLPSNPAFVPFGALALSFYFATAINVNSPYQMRGFVSSSLMVMNIAILVLVYDQASRDKKGYDRVRNLALGGAAAFSAFGILVLILYQVGVSLVSPLIEFRTLGDWTLTGGADLVPRPVFLEPNSASYLGALGVFALGMTLAMRGRLAIAYGAGAILLLAGDVLAYSRGAWLGTIVGVISVAALAAARPGWANVRPRRILLVLGLTAIAVLLLFALVPSVREVLIGRGANLLNIQQGTGLARVSYWELLWNDALNQPILGHGADEYKTLLPPPLVAESASVEIFHVAGIVGLGAYLIANVVILAMLVTTVFDANASSIRIAVGASALGSFVALIASSQLNPSMWGNMYWLVLGIALASAGSHTWSATMSHGSAAHDSVPQTNRLLR